MPSVVSEATPSCVVAIFGPTTMYDAEWEAFVAVIRDAIAAGIPARCLVISDGAAPGTKQRAKLEATLTPVRSRLKVAILTDSTFVRGVVNAFALVTPGGYRAFAPDRFDEAMTFLEMRPAQAEEIRAAVMRLRGRLPRR